MNTDIRVSLGFLDHPKTRLLKRRLGADGVIALIRFWCFTAQNCPGGTYENRTEEYLELAADWEGEPGAFIETALAVGFIERVNGGFRVHDWEVHNGYASYAAKRSDAARRAANMRWEKRHGCATMPEQCGGNAGALHQQCGGNAPSPAPAPAPSPAPSPSPPPKGEKERPPIAPRGGASVGEDEISNPPADEPAETPPEETKPRRKRKPLDVTTPYSPAFETAWAAYPVSGRKGKGAAFRAWERYRLAGRLPDLPTFTASVRAHEEHDEKWRNGYVPNMATYLNQARWEDAIEAPTEDGGEPPPLMPFDHPDILECQAKMRAGELPLLTEIIAEMAGKRTLANMDAERKRRNDEFMAKHGLKRAVAASSD